MNKNYLLPGEPLRKGVDLIADKKSGGLIVIGSSNKLEKISSGGINLKNCSYTPEMLSELAKMDGAVIVGIRWNDWKIIPTLVLLKLASLFSFIS